MHARSYEAFLFFYRPLGITYTVHVYDKLDCQELHSTHTTRIRSCGAARFLDYVIDFTDKTMSADYDDNPPRKRTPKYAHISSTHRYPQNETPSEVYWTLVLAILVLHASELRTFDILPCIIIYYSDTILFFCQP